MSTPGRSRFSLLLSTTCLRPTLMRRKLGHVSLGMRHVSSPLTSQTRSSYWLTDRDLISLTVFKH
eukprot:9975629-Prorocentrum_lima.AAC.1